MNFTLVPILNREVFSILDTSKYEEDYVVNPIITFKFPNFKKTYQSSYNVGDISTYTTEKLNYSDCQSDFPDGIYEITISSGKESITKRIFRTIDLEIRFSELLNINNLTIEQDFNRINKIYLYIKSAQYSVCSNESLAKEYYNIADKLLTC